MYVCMYNCVYRIVKITLEKYGDLDYIESFITFRKNIFVLSWTVLPFKLEVAPKNIQHNTVYNISLPADISQSFGNRNVTENLKLKQACGL